MNEKNEVKVQIWPDPNNLGINPGWIKNTDPAIKDSEEYNYPVPILGPSTIPLPGILSFDPNDEDLNKFKGCVGVENNVGKYVSFSTTTGDNGLNGKDLKINLNFTNLLGDTKNNIGQIFNTNSSIITSTTTETLNSITTNNSFQNHPYQLFTENNKQQIGFKKIFFVPNSDFTSYNVKIRNPNKNLNTVKIWDFEDDTNFIEETEINFKTSLNKKLVNKKFKFYDTEIDGISNLNILYLQKEGFIGIGDKQSFKSNSIINHNLKKKLSFLFSKLSFDSSSTIKYGLINNDNLLVIQYKNILKQINSINYYVNIQIKLSLSDNSYDNIFTDDDINLSPGTIVISYGEIPLQFTSPLIGLSNKTTNEEINYDTFLDTQWIDENGYGVPKLKTIIGALYSDPYTSSIINNIFGGKINNAESFYDSSTGKTKVRLLIDDNDWGNYYSEVFNDTEYYIKTIDIGNLLPDKFFLSIQSIYDYPTYSVSDKNYYSCITGTKADFDGLITDWKTFVDDTNLTIDLTSLTIGNSWLDITPDNIQKANTELNSLIHKIYIRRQLTGSFSSTGIFTRDNTNLNYFIKIIYTLNSDKDSEKSNFLSYISNYTYGPYHFNPIHSNLATLETDSSYSFISNITYTLSVISNKTYKLSLKDYKGDSNRNGYGFVLQLKTDDAILQTVNNSSEFPTLSFSVPTSNSKIYKLVVSNDRKYPYFGIVMEEITVIDDYLLEYNRGIEFKIKDNSTLNTLSLFINEDEETISKWNLKEDTTTALGTSSFTYKINFEESNTIDLNSDYSLLDFCKTINKFIKYSNDNKTSSSDLIASENYIIETNTSDFGNLQFSNDDETITFPKSIYLPFIIPKTKRDYLSVEKDYGTDITLNYNSSNFEIYKNKYYLNFPLNPSAREFPANIGSTSDITLYNSMVIDFSIIHKTAGQYLDITSLNFSLDDATTDLRYIVKVPGNLFSTTKTYTITVDSGKFLIDGVSQDTLTIYKGFTYIFNQTNSTNNNHPLKLSETSDGTHNSGNQYTSGWTDNSGTAGTDLISTFVVPEDAPGTLYYYCANHSGMGGTINISSRSIDMDNLFDPDENLEKDLYDSEFLDFINKNLNEKEKIDYQTYSTSKGLNVGDITETDDTIYLLSDSSNKGYINIDTSQQITNGRIYIGYLDSVTDDNTKDTFKLTIKVNSTASGSNIVKFTHRILYP